MSKWTPKYPNSTAVEAAHRLASEGLHPAQRLDERQGWIEAGSQAADACHAQGLLCPAEQADFSDELEAATAEGWSGDRAQAAEWMREGWRRYVASRLGGGGGHMSKHTPGPWTFREGKYQNHVIESTNGRYYVATVEGGIIVDPQEQEANAAFIVRACNAHNDLLEALKDLLAPNGPGDASATLQLRIDRAHAAIAKAEGKG